MLADHVESLPERSLELQAPRREVATNNMKSLVLDQPAGSLRHCIRSYVSYVSPDGVALKHLLWASCPSHQHEPRQAHIQDRMHHTQRLTHARRSQACHAHLMSGLMGQRSTVNDETPVLGCCTVAVVV